MTMIRTSQRSAMRLSAAAVLTLSLALPVAAQTTPPAAPGVAAAISGAPTPAAAASEGVTFPEPGTISEGLPPDLTAVTFENGRWYNAEGLPTFKIEDGVVDYATFSGYRRYHSECHVCHGPDGEGSTYAPALKNSVMRVTDYYAFMEIVASGKQDVNAAANQVMPAFGTNRNVWCYIDDIYTYLLARGVDAVPRGRPPERADKSEEYAALEDSCMEN
ncbi:c-type cytochrome, methanol metabolism-related [Paracoccus sp. S-4012]|uniref:c-type cytochrome, methanol metabolism-related n=1 Tax=Paracoccus sp. S-4012 TaxID=2665648 RepID=UPI0012AFF45A|nr:c-type cytochrome, methanol metabolism-related [Paracoccus sp. S-4012]MRX51738.1 c-type cytochrome, methanol metabolism-related [Paracoccus sp. S-4012]